MTELFRELTVELATEAVCSKPPETRRSCTPSEIVRVELARALKRSEESEIGVATIPVKPVTSETLSALFQVVTSSLPNVLTATMLPPVAKPAVVTVVAKLVTPEPSVTVAAAPRTPTMPVNTSLAVVVVIPFAEL